MTDHERWQGLSAADLLLGAIAAPMVSGALAAFLSPVTLGTALAAGSVPAAGGVGYALFRHQPE